MKKIFKKFKFLRSFDIFGYPVTLTMKENYEYKSIFGGLLALLFQLFFLLIIIITCYRLFSYKYMTVSESANNLGSSYGVLELNQSSFRFALKFQNAILNNWTQPYFNITLYHVIQFRNTSSVYRLVKEIPTKNCNKSDFGDLEDEFLELQLDGALCPELSANLTLEGNYQENIFSYFQIALDTCNDSSICQNETTISGLSSSLGCL